MSAGTADLAFAPDQPIVAVGTARTPVEEKLIRSWVDEHLRGHPGGMDLFVLPRGASTTGDFTALSRRMEGDGEALLVPIGVTWLPAEHQDGSRKVSVTDLVRGRNPYKPKERQQAQIARTDPDRGRIVVGTSAALSRVRDRFAEGGGDATQDPVGFARYVGRRGRLALQRADAQLLGPQFKSAKLVKDEILASRHFQAGLANLRASLGPVTVTTEKVEEILDELATGWSRYFVDVFPRVGRAVFGRGFDPQIDTVPAEIDRLRATTADHPVSFLWSHRSNLDNLVFTACLEENDFPLPYLFAGINMSFGPMGSIMRRAGVVFIRRTIGDNALYKFILKEYVGYLAEKRFNLSWSIEGTRSRTGKMLPPKLGILGFVADAYIEGRSDDIALQPVSITFDQLHEIGEYAEYARGGKKAAEGFSWLYNFIKAQGANNFGKIYVRFPEPVMIRTLMGPPNGETATGPAKRKLALQKLAFEVAWRMNEATPVTSTALVTTILLGVQGTAMTAAQVTTALERVLDYLDARSVPLASSVANLRTASGVEQVLAALAASGTVTRVDGARDRVWLIKPEDQLAATFYRNAIVHRFLISAICEMALVLAEREADPGPDRVAAFWAAVDRLRDLLKFEFYFKEKSEYRSRVDTEMARSLPDWQERLAASDFDVRRTLTAMWPLFSPFTLRPFFEAYEIVADVLMDYPETGPIEKTKVTKDALKLGDQFVAQKRVSSEEPVSSLLFGTALQLADNLGVLAEGPDRPERVANFRTRLHDVLDAIDVVATVMTDVFARERRRAHRPAAQSHQA